MLNTIETFLKCHDVPIEKEMLDGHEILLLPDFDIAIRWSDSRLDSRQFEEDLYFSQRLMLISFEAGIDLMTIPSHLFEKKREILFGMILNKIGKTDVKTVYGRKCVVREVETSVYKDFLMKNHIHGYRGAKVQFGLFHDEELVAVLSASRRNKATGEWEIVRYCTSKKVLGGFSKLFKKFKEEKRPNSVVSFADALYWRGCSYRNAGFVIDELTKPNYCYVDAKGNFVGSRQQFQKHKLHKVLRKFDASLTERENCRANGLFQLYDCGHWKWIWKDMERKEIPSIEDI